MQRIEIQQCSQALLSPAADFHIEHKSDITSDCLATVLESEARWQVLTAQKTCNAQTRRKLASESSTTDGPRTEDVEMKEMTIGDTSHKHNVSLS